MWSSAVAVQAGGGNAATVSDDASKKGIKGGASVVVDGGTLAVDAADDALHSNGSVTVNGGSVTVASGDDGINFAGDGTSDATADTTDTADAGGMGGGGMGGGEAANQANQLTINGGTLVVDADGDGLDSNGDATITGGTIVVNGPTTDGNGALDVNGTFTVSGGTLLAAGSSGMAVAPSTSSTQGWVAATLTTAVPAGTAVVRAFQRMGRLLPYSQRAGYSTRWSIRQPRSPSARRIPCTPAAVLLAMPSAG